MAQAHTTGAKLFILQFLEVYMTSPRERTCRPLKMSDPLGTAYFADSAVVWSDIIFRVEDMNFSAGEFGQSCDSEPGNCVCYQLFLVEGAMRAVRLCLETFLETASQTI